MIEKFLFDFHGCIFDDHLLQITEIKRMLDDYENMELIESIYGKHFKNCPFLCRICDRSNTCECNEFKLKKDNVIHLIEKYYTFFITKINT